MRTLPESRRAQRPLDGGRSRGSYPGALAPALRAGIYFVQLYSGSGELLREYGLEIQRTP